MAIQVKKCPVRVCSQNVFIALAERTALLAARFFIIDGLKSCVNTHKDSKPLKERSGRGSPIRLNHDTKKPQ